MMKCYIIGAVTGLPREYVEAKFRATAEVIKSTGLIPVVPIDLVSEDSDWNSAMRTCIKALVECDAFIAHDDIDQSKGAILEKTIAINLGLLHLRLQKNGRILIP